MNTISSDIAIAFFIGLTVGVLAVRYGIGLGTKIINKAEQGLSLDGKSQHSEDEYTE